LGIPKVTAGGNAGSGGVNFGIETPGMSGWGIDKFKGTPKLNEGGNAGIGGRNLGILSFGVSNPKFTSTSIFGFGNERFRGNPKFRLGGKLTGSGGKGIATENEYS
jgi:hypothetical protein